MASKRYQIKTACPQCGCAEVTVLSAQEMQEKYGDEPQITQDCSECLATYEAHMDTACPEWDQDCRLQE